LGSLFIMLYKSLNFEIAFFFCAGQTGHVLREGIKENYPKSELAAVEILILD
jgi:hypothetical protein